MVNSNSGLKNIYIYVFLFLIVCIVVLLNAGRFFDISEKPEKADIIVYLGGGSYERIEKALEVYQDGYSQTGKIIFTGPPSFHVDKKRKIFQNRITYFTDHGVSEKKIIYRDHLENTMKEILFIKEYMQQHHLKKVMFVSDPPHSRRIMFLANSIADYSEAGLSCSVVGSDTDWWSKTHYYRNSKAIAFIVSESIRLPYNYVAYGILEKLGLLEVVKEHAGSSIRSIKSSISLFLDEIVFSEKDVHAEP